jgi:hypothetical protein
MGGAGTQRRSPISASQVEPKSTLASYALLGANEVLQQRMAFKESLDEFETLSRAVCMTMDGDAGSESANESLIPVKPRYLSLQETPPDAQVIAGLD